MNFNNLIRIHEKIEEAFPGYGYALNRYELTDSEKQNQKIKTKKVTIFRTTNYYINGETILIGSDDPINWSDFLTASELHQNNVMYRLYLLALAMDDDKSRIELRNIFAGEELESRHFNDIECNDNYLGKHILDSDGWCVCQNS